MSLMQMPRTTVALQELKEAGLPYIVVLTDPTTGGVTASYAMLGDVQLAEPGALIGFAGQRVIEQTIREKLPEGFQRAEYLLEHGMIDMVVPRGDLKEKLALLISYLAPEAKESRLMADFARSTDPKSRRSSTACRSFRLPAIGWGSSGFRRFSTGLAVRRTRCRRSSMSPGPMGKARRSLSCAPRSRRADTASTPSPARTSCASTSASGLPGG